MKLQELKQGWLNLINRMNRLGIPVPVVRDPRTGKGSITASLVVFSSGLFGFCIMFMLAASVAKWAGAFVMTTEALLQVKTAADYSFQFLLAALGGYLGRHFQKGESIDSQDPQPPQGPSKLPQKPDDPDQQ
jgi:hypothetical protein